MKEKVHKLRVCYPDNEKEEVTGIIDYEHKLIRLIDINPDLSIGFKEKGIINLDYVKKIDIIDHTGCISDSSEECNS